MSVDPVDTEYDGIAADPGRYRINSRGYEKVYLIPRFVLYQIQTFLQAFFDTAVKISRKQIVCTSKDRHTSVISPVECLVINIYLTTTPRLEFDWLRIRLRSSDHPPHHYGESFFL